MARHGSVEKQGGGGPKVFPSSKGFTMGSKGTPHIHVGKAEVYSGGEVKVFTRRGSHIDLVSVLEVFWFDK